MKKLSILLLLILITSCAVTVEPTGEHCYKGRVCTGDTYIYLNNKVTVIDITNSRCRVKRYDGTTYWVNIHQFERLSHPEKVKHPKKEKQNRGRDKGRGRY